MTVLRLPINLMTTALGQPDTPSASVLLSPELRCDRVGGRSLQTEDHAVATRTEVYVVVAGYGAMRCEDGSLIDMTAGDVVYVAPGTSRGFVTLSGKFSALRLTFPAIPGSTDSG